MSMEEYQNGKVPALSSGIAHLLCTSSPLHAWTEHPALNPNYVREDKEEFDLGTVVHALVLEGVNKAEVLDFPDWRTNDAKGARSLARLNRRIPILKKNYSRVERMTLRIREQLSSHKDARDAFLIGDAEQTLIWHEDGIRCKARLDWLNGVRNIYDLKTTGISANPEVVSRSLFANGNDIQAAWYLRGLKAVTGIDAQFRFVYVETFEPYALSVIGLGPDALMIGEKKCLYAIQKFRECLESKEWPGYSNRTCYATLPEWEERKWIERELREVR